MRVNDAAQHQVVLRNYERRARLGVSSGLLRLSLDDTALSGPEIHVDGRPLVSFGSCSYMALNLDDRLTAAASEAVGRFGVTYSSSTVYTSLGLYRELEDLLCLMVGGRTLVTPTTTLAHLTALPVMIGPGDVALVDAQAHSSVHMALQILRSEGITVEVLPHNDVEALEAAVGRVASDHHAVWYLADGVYSMFGDVAPVARLDALLDRHPNLFLYLDDAHGFSWHGENGRGWVLERMPMHPRLVLALSLSKSFGSGGGALAFGDPDLAERVLLLGGPLTFGGPVQVAELAAGVASARIHLSPEHRERRSAMEGQIDHVLDLAGRLGLPLRSTARTPVWFLHVGRIEHTVEIAQRMMRDGFYLTPASFPAVPLGAAGLRFAHTLHHSLSDIDEMLTRLAEHYAEVVEDDVGIRVELDLTSDPDRSPTR